ncbi:MAG: hypothetical protein WC184_02245 [Acidimicrobiia bacterium]
MNTQGLVLVTFAIIAMAIVALFVVVALTSRGPTQRLDEVSTKGYALRRWWFAILSTTLILAFLIMIPFYPYGRSKSSANENAIHYNIIARQYLFEGLPPQIPVDTPIIFEVYAADVNHGFAIYNPDNQLIGQVQAMPSYRNELVMTFTEVGQYSVRCLEFCGIGHHLMGGSFTVGEGND